MKSFYHAYQAYERRVIRGEFDDLPRKTKNRSNPIEPLLSQLGDLLIQMGLKLKQQHATSKPLAWSPMIGSKP